MIGAQTRNQLDAADVGQGDVEQQQVERVGLQAADVQGFGCAGGFGGDDDVTGGGDDLLESATQDGVVVGDEDLEGHGGVGVPGVSGGE